MIHACPFRVLPRPLSCRSFQHDAPLLLASGGLQNHMGWELWRPSCSHVEDAHLRNVQPQARTSRDKERGGILMMITLLPCVPVLRNCNLPPLSPWLSLTTIVTLLTPCVRVSPTKQFSVIAAGVLQFNSILTLSTWR